jgi:NAD(P)-dependent dehydrogenase (short-subunit alcohol dehydrogenase family)
LLDLQHTALAVITLSELLAEEYKERGISFNVLALGAVQTEMLEEAFPGYQAPIKANEMADYIFDFTSLGINIITEKYCRYRLRTLVIKCYHPWVIVV